MRSIFNSLFSSDKKYKPEPVFDVRAELGEGPLWNASQQKVYWVDIKKGLFFIGDPDSQEVEQHTIGKQLGSLAFREKGGLIMALEDGFGTYDPINRELSMLEAVPSMNTEVRFNDGLADPAGRFFAGTMDKQEHRDLGKLYRLDPDLSVHILEKDIYISNGMGWSLDRKTYFYIDTLSHCVAAYDYDLETGNISNKRIHIEFGFKDFPDGMTMDSEGGFWIAFWGAAKVVHFDPQGEKVEEINLPVLHPTSCCFGGKDLKTLFITSAYTALKGSKRAEYPLAGSTFRVETDTVGLLPNYFKG